MPAISGTFSGTPVAAKAAQRGGTRRKFIEVRDRWEPPMASETGGWRTFTVSTGTRSLQQAPADLVDAFSGSRCGRMNFREQLWRHPFVVVQVCSA